MLWPCILFLLRSRWTLSKHLKPTAAVLQSASASFQQLYVYGFGSMHCKDEPRICQIALSGAMCRAIMMRPQQRCVLMCHAGRCMGDSRIGRPD